MEVCRPQNLGAALRAVAAAAELVRFVEGLVELTAKTNHPHRSFQGTFKLFV